MAASVDREQPQVAQANATVGNAAEKISASALVTRCRFVFIPTPPVCVPSHWLPAIAAPASAGALHNRTAYSRMPPKTRQMSIWWRRKTVATQARCQSGEGGGCALLRDADGGSPGGYS